MGFKRFMSGLIGTGPGRFDTSAVATGSNGFWGTPSVRRRNAAPANWSLGNPLCETEERGTGELERLLAATSRPQAYRLVVENVRRGGQVRFGQDGPGSGKVAGNHKLVWDGPVDSQLGSRPVVQEPQLNHP